MGQGAPPRDERSRISVAVGGWGGALARVVISASRTQVGSPVAGAIVLSTQKPAPLRDDKEAGKPAGSKPAWCRRLHGGPVIATDRAVAKAARAPPPRYPNRRRAVRPPEATVRPGANPSGHMPDETRPRSRPATCSPLCPPRRSEFACRVRHGRGTPSGAGRWHIGWSLDRFRVAWNALRKAAVLIGRSARRVFSAESYQLKVLRNRTTRRKIDPPAPGPAPRLNRKLLTFEVAGAQYSCGNIGRLVVVMSGLEGNQRVVKQQHR